MQFFKAALLLAAVSLAPQSHSYDLTTQVLKALESYIPNTDKPAKSRESAPRSEVVLPAVTGNFGGCRENFANGESPTVPNAKELRARALCFNGFAVLHSGMTKTPVFTAAVLSRERMDAAKGLKRTNKFFADARLPSAERATLEDYKGSTFQRGHQFAAADATNEDSMAQSFSLANMVPQSPVNNSKSWAGLEKATRSYAQRAKGDIYVITGPVFTPDSCPFVLAAKRVLVEQNLAIPASNSRIVSQAVETAGFLAPRSYDADACTIGAGVAVPSHLFKLVYDPTTQRAWAHWLENVDWARVSAPISYDELVRRTGIKFLPGVHPRS
jgi:endonuclease G